MLSKNNNKEKLIKLTNSNRNNKTKINRINKMSMINYPA